MQEIVKNKTLIAEIKEKELLLKKNNSINIQLEKANKIHIRRSKKIKKLNLCSIFLFGSFKRKRELENSLKASREYFNIKFNILNNPI